MEQIFSKTLKDLTSTEVVDILRARLQQWEGQGGRGECSGAAGERVWSTGCQPLDGRLPAGGWCPGRLVEWLGEGVGSGVELFMLQAARAMLTSNVRKDRRKDGPRACCVSERVWVVVDREAHFFPPVALAWKLDPRQLLVVRPQTMADELWALDQILRCPAVALVTAWLPCLAPRDFRRLQLAAEQGGAVGCLIRPATVRGQPSWSDLQILVQPLPLDAQRGHPPRASSVTCRRWRLEILRCRGGRAGQSFWVELDEQSGCMQEWVP